MPYVMTVAAGTRIRVKPCSGQPGIDREKFVQFPISFRAKSGLFFYVSTMRAREKFYSAHGRICSASERIEELPVNPIVASPRSCA